MPDHSLTEDDFPNIKPEPPLNLQLEAIPSCPVTTYAEEADPPHLTTPSFQAVVGSYKVSPEHPLLQTKQSQKRNNGVELQWQCQGMGDREQANLSEKI